MPIDSGCTQNIPLEEAFLVNFIEKAHRTNWKTKYFRSTQNEPYLSGIVVIATSIFYSATNWYAKEVWNKSMICNLLYGNVMCCRLPHSYFIHSCSPGDIPARSVCNSQCNTLGNIVVGTSLGSGKVIYF